MKMLTNFRIGGTERQVANLVVRIDPSRFELHLGCLSQSGELLQELESLQVPRPEFQISRLYGWSTWCQAKRLAEYIKAHNIQIVHSYGFYANIFAIPAARLARAVVVASIRDTGEVLTPMQRRVQKAICRLADCVLVNAEAIRSALIHQGYGTSNIEVIRNGIALGTFEGKSRAGVRNALGIGESDRLILVSSRLNRMKGIEYFLEAASAVSRKIREAKFLIVGDGADRAPLEKRASELKLNDRVVFTGFRTDVPDLLSEASLSVLPSLSEGLSNSLLESMASGVPVVATSVGGNPEVVEDGVTGILVPPRDPEALAVAMTRILADQSLASRFGEAGKKRVATLYSIERNVRETEQLYESLIERHHAA